MKYFEIASTPDSVVISNGDEALSLSIGNRESIKNLMQYGKEQIPAEDKEHYDATKPTQTYEQKALRNIRITRMKVNDDNKISFTPADKSYDSIDNVVSDLIKPYICNPITAKLNYQRREQEGEYSIKRMENHMRNEALKNLPGRIEKAEKELKGLDEKAMNENWSVNKLHENRSNSKKEIASMKEKLANWTKK